MITKWLILLFISLPFCSCMVQIKCCPGDNTMKKGRCLYDNSTTRLDCQKYMIDLAEEENGGIDEENNLIFGSTITTPDNYCAVKEFNSSNEIYLVCYDESETEEPHLFLTVLGFVSVGFLFMTLIVYGILPELQDLQGVCIIHSISGLALGFLFLGINQLTTSFEQNLCEAITFVTYFSFMYAFFWLNTLSFHIWRTTIKPSILEIIKKWKYIYHVYAITGPIILLIYLMIGHYGSIASLDHVKPKIGEGTCWFSTLKSQFAYFYGPIMVLVFCNIIFYVWTLVVLCIEIGNTRQKRVLFFRLKLCLKLFFIMGVPWAFEIISAAYKVQSLEVLWMITDALNTIQGILIFCILVLFRKKVLRGLANKQPFSNLLPNRWRNLEDEENEDHAENEDHNTIDDKTVTNNILQK